MAWRGGRWGRKLSFCVGQSQLGRSAYRQPDLGHETLTHPHLTRDTHTLKYVPHTLPGLVPLPLSELFHPSLSSLLVFAIPPISWASQRRAPLSVSTFERSKATLGRSPISLPRPKQRYICVASEVMRRKSSWNARREFNCCLILGLEL